MIQNTVESRLYFWCFLGYINIILDIFKYLYSLLEMISSFPQSGMKEGLVQT
jgi:hypothetical protein